MSRPYWGDINDLSYIFPSDLSLPELRGSFLSELFGLSSGIKRNAIIGDMSNTHYLNKEEDDEMFEKLPLSSQINEIDIKCGEKTVTIIKNDRVVLIDPVER